MRPISAAAAVFIALLTINASVRDWPYLTIAFYAAMTALNVYIGLAS